MTITDDQILQMRPLLEAAFTEGTAPEQFASEISEGVDPGLIQAMASVVTPERITSALTKAEGGSRSPLVRRQGQQWLKGVFSSIRGMSN
jgi:hypothetical protein